MKSYQHSRVLLAHNMNIDSYSFPSFFLWCQASPDLSLQTMDNAERFTRMRSNFSPNFDANECTNGLTGLHVPLKPADVLRLRTVVLVLLLRSRR